MSLLLLFSATAGASYITIELPGYRDTQAYGINNSNEITGTVGAVSSGLPINANFIASPAGSPTVLTYSGGPFQHFMGVNDAGQIVVQQGAGDPGLLRNADGSTAAISPPGTAISPVGINNSGVIVGADTVASMGVIRSAAGVLTYVNVNGNQAFPRGVNASGLVTGTSEDTSFLFDPATSTYTSFNVPAAISTDALGINDLGVTVGYYIDSNGAEHGFIRNADGTFTFFNFPGAFITAITGINDAGNFVGYYALPGEEVFGSGDGKQEFHAFFATPDAAVPEPSAFLPLIFSGALFVFYRRKG